MAAALPTASDSHAVPIGVLLHGIRIPGASTGGLDPKCSGTAARKFIAMSTERVVAVFNDYKVADCSVIAARLVEAARLARDGNCEAAKAQIARAMALLRGEPSTIPPSARSLTGVPQEATHGGLPVWKKRRLTSYIDEHLTEPIRVADLAALAGLSESHFNRAFRCTFGASAHEYLTRRRIEVAQSLMIGSSEPLCAIALRCGLSDQSHFTRVFRRTVGETPHLWRRERRGEIENRPTELTRSETDRRHLSPNRASFSCC